jgi:hypothetical protein
MVYGPHLNFFYYRGNNWDYLSFRLCIGIWIGILLLIMVTTLKDFFHRSSGYNKLDRLSLRHSAE